MDLLTAHPDPQFQLLPLLPPRPPHRRRRGRRGASSAAARGAVLHQPHRRCLLPGALFPLLPRRRRQGQRGMGRCRKAERRNGGRRGQRARAKITTGLLLSAGYLPQGITMLHEHASYSKRLINLALLHEFRVGRLTHLVVEEVVEGILGVKGDVTRLAHPHPGQPVGAGTASPVGVADEGLQPLQPVAQQHNVVAVLEQGPGLAHGELPELGKHRRDGSLRHGWGSARLAS